MRRSPWVVGLLLAVGLLACGDDTTVFGADGGSSSTGGQSSSGRGGDGAGGGGGAAVYGVGNVDDDDLDGQADWLGGWVDVDNDLSPFTLPDEFRAEVQAGHTLELTLSGDVDAIRVWHDGEPLLGPDASWQTLTTATLSGSQAGDTLEVEFADFHQVGSLLVRHLGSGASEIATLEVPLVSSPLMLSHHLQPAEHVWVVNNGATAAVVQAFQSVLGSRVTVVNNPDPWIQDELEWGVATAPGIRLDVAVDSIRDRQLDAWVKSLKAPDLQPITWGQAGTDTTEDKFGNLETAPPPVAAGDYPLGRIYLGDNGVVGPNAILQGFLDAQALQLPLRLDVGWLCIGHVDEFLAFIPDPSSAKGFKLLYADVNAAWAVLETMNANTAIPRYQSSHGYGNVGSMLADGALRALNEEIQLDHLDPILAQLKAELGLDESDVIRVPSLFERASNCWYSNDWLEVSALIPGLVNLTVVNIEGEPIRLFFPDPYMRTSDGDQGSDPIIAALTAALPAGYELYFVDDWYSYHVLMGEVHCGSNVMRTPEPNWWQTGMHLLGGP